jgi:hypothetical protein
MKAVSAVNGNVMRKKTFTAVMGFETASASNLSSAMLSAFPIGKS